MLHRFGDSLPAGSGWNLYNIYHCCACGPGSVLGIATGYMLDGPGIKSRWGRDFPALGPTQPPVQWVPGLSQGVKSGRGVTLTPHPFQCRSHERVELYLYSPYGPYGLYRASVPVQRCTLHLPLLLCVQRKTPDDGQRHCPKHSEFHSKNRFEKLVHVVGFYYTKLTKQD